MKYTAYNEPLFKLGMPRVETRGSKNEKESISVGIIPAFHLPLQYE